MKSQENVDKKKSLQQELQDLSQEEENFSECDYDIETNLLINDEIKVKEEEKPLPPKVVAPAVRPGKNDKLLKRRKAGIKPSKKFAKQKVLKPKPKPAKPGGFSGFSTGGG